MPKDRIIFRSANKKDLAVIADLCLALLEYHYGFDFYYKPSSDAKNVYYNRLVEGLSLKTKKIFLAEINNEIAGFIMVEIQTPPSFFAFEKQGFISEAYIVENYRNKGILKELLNKMEFWFKENNVLSVVLNVHLENDSALEIWEKLGYSRYRVNCRKIL